MSEENLGDKTEQATPRRRQEARERGQVAKSTDLNAAIILLGSLLVLSLVGPRMLGLMMHFMEESFAGGWPTSMTVEDLPILGGKLARLLLAILGPLALCLFVLAILSNVLQSGFVLSGQPLMPQLGRLNPITGLQRIFSARGAVRLGASMAKMIVMAVIIYVTIAGEINHFSVLAEADHHSVIAFGLAVVFKLAVRLAVALLILGILDFAFQYLQHEKDMRMTKQEVRDELKRMEGDPLIRERRRRVQRQLAIQRMMQQVPKATVVITNPTHYSVALRYDSTMEAPRCVAKGADHLALRIRRQAEEHGIPLVERPPLARALYDSIEVGQEIPAEFYQTVAEVLAYVYELNRKLGKPVPTVQPAAR